MNATKELGPIQELAPLAGYYEYRTLHILYISAHYARSLHFCIYKIPTNRQEYTVYSWKLIY